MSRTVRIELGNGQIVVVEHTDDEVRLETNADRQGRSVWLSPALVAVVRAALEPER